MKNCQYCNSVLDAFDFAADPETTLCRTCWQSWRAQARMEDGSPPVRYGTQPGIVCPSCGMGFASLLGFKRHRKGQRCLSPTELLAQTHPLTLKDGIWVMASAQAKWASLVAAQAS